MDEETEKILQDIKCCGCYTILRIGYRRCEEYLKHLRMHPESFPGSMCPKFWEIDRDVERFVLGYDNFSFPNLVRAVMADPEIELKNGVL